jgi:hypothetical protein
MSDLTASDCQAECAWIVAKCASSRILGSQAYGICLAGAAVANAHCHDCIAELVKTAFSGDIGCVCNWKIGICHGNCH